MRGHFNVFESYAGYLHVVPRAAALLVVNALDVRNYAFGINTSACVVTGIVAAVVYIGAEDVVPNGAVRAWLASTTVLLPVLGVEVLANLANLHSLMMWGAFWALMRHPRTLGGAIALACFELLATLTEVQSVFLLPLALLVLWRHRSLRQALVVCAFFVGAASQLVSALTHERPGSSPHLLSLTIVAQLLALEVVMPLWLMTMHIIRGLLETYGWWLSAVAALPLFVGIALALRHGDSDQRWAAAAALGMGLTIFCMSHMLNGAVMGGPDYSTLDQAPILYRYAVTPSLFFMVSLAIGTAAAGQRERRFERWLGIASIAALLYGPITLFRTEENMRDPHTSWNKQLREAHAICRAPGSQETHFEISPPPWGMSVPCSRLTETR